MSSKPFVSNSNLMDEMVTRQAHTIITNSTVLFIGVEKFQYRQEGRWMEHSVPATPMARSLKTLEIFRWLECLSVPQSRVHDYIQLN